MKEASYAGFEYSPTIAIIDKWRGQRLCSHYSKTRYIMEVEETIIVKKSSVSCDGGGGALGHPKIYLAIPEDGEIVCPYCSRTYKLAESASQAAGH
jgi:uncharacterized Zn-finger protein